VSLGGGLPKVKARGRGPAAAAEAATVTNPRNSVNVIDADSDTEVGKVTGLKRNHGVAVVPKLGKGFITDGGTNEVVIFDLKTLKTTERVKTDPRPDSIIYDPASQRIFSFNGQGKDATVIDPKSETVVGTIPLGGTPEFAVADGKGKSMTTSRTRARWR
jgi:hypothetical protein